MIFFDKKNHFEISYLGTLPFSPGRLTTYGMVMGTQTDVYFAALGLFAPKNVFDVLASSMPVTAIPEVGITIFAENQKSLGQIFHDFSISFLNFEFLQNSKKIY